VYLWQTLEGWLHRAVVRWLALTLPQADAKTLKSVERLELWLPATAAAAATASSQMVRAIDQLSMVQMPDYSLQMLPR
jgi:hypothetical protein